MDPAVPTYIGGMISPMQQKKNFFRFLGSYLAAHIPPPLYHAVSSALPTSQIRPGSSCFVVHVSGE